MQRVAGTVLVVLVTLAGCSGVFGGGGEPRETLTPASVPTDEPTPTPVPQLAPGLNQQGIENANALIAAHSSFRRNHSFTTRSNSTQLDQNGTVRFRSTSTLHAGPPGTGVYAVSDTERKINDQYPNNQSYLNHVESWMDGKRVFQQLRYTNGTTTYVRQKATSRLGSGAFLQSMLKPYGTANTSVTERERNGTTLYLVRGSTQSDQGLGSENVSLRLLIDTEGVIHSLHVTKYLSYNGVSAEGGSSRVIFEQNISGIGTTDAPERPSWVGEATNQTSPIPEKTSTRYQ